MVSAYDELPRTAANFVALSPLRYLERAAYIYPQQAAIIHGERQITWQHTYQRCRQFAHQLAKLGIQKNDTVSVLLPNIPAMIEAHFAVPMAGAVLNTLNTRLDAKTIAFMLEHAESKVLLVDPEFREVAAEALKLVPQEIVVIDVFDSEFEGEQIAIGQYEYESWLAQGNPEFEWLLPQDEWDAISLNYTSGTTGNPKGVVYHHRGAYLNAASNILACGMKPRAVYLWTLPLFHCNGWCFAWSIAASGG
ncbi:AMP-binding protein, partial [Pseudomonas vancouverensis]